jgi:hypothetical protein
MKKIVIWTLLISVTQAWAWEVDLSRRQVDFNRVTNQQRAPASATDEEPMGLLQKALDIPVVSQDIVIMQTESGFVPEKVNVKKGGSYKIYVVNVNPKQKNSSFIMDAFSEHHATAYGKVKSFTINPKVDGVFSFQSPEAGVEGRLIVAPNTERKPSSNN